MIKDTVEQLEWRGTKGNVWEGPEHRNFCPHEVGVCQPPGMDVFTSLEALCILCNWDFNETSPRRYDLLLTPFPAPLPSLEKGEGAKNSKLLITT